MALFSRALHHFHLRKRIHENLEPYPHPDKWKNFLDRIIVFVGILSPISTLPQLYKVWFEQETAGVSVFSWSIYLFVSAVWLLYGIVHKEKPLIITYIFWVIILTMLLIGLIIY